MQPQGCFQLAYSHWLLCPAMVGNTVLAGTTAQAAAYVLCCLQCLLIPQAESSCLPLSSTLLRLFRGKSRVGLCSGRGSRQKWEARVCTWRWDELLWELAAGGRDPEIHIQTLWVSKGDHSAMTPSRLFPSLLPLPFLPIPPPVLINIYLIHLIPVEVWHQGTELKVYEINACDEKNEAIVQGRKCSQREWLVKRRKHEFPQDHSPEEHVKGGGREV